MSSDPKLVPFVLPLITGNSVLDVGCGRGKWGFLCRVDYWYTSAGRRREELRLLVGVDLFTDYLKFARLHRVYDHVVQASALALPFRDRSFDTTLVMEILEHVPKPSGGRVLSEAERVSNRRIIATSPFNPLGLRRQRSVGSNRFQEHLSKWSNEDFERLGYRTLGRPFPFEKWVNLLQHMFPSLRNMLPQLPACAIATKRLEGSKYSSVSR